MEYCVLLQLAPDFGEYVIGRSTDQTDCADNYDENHCEHHRVLGNVLAFIVKPNASQNLHSGTSQMVQLFRSRLSRARGGEGQQLQSTYDRRLPIL